MTPLKSIRHHCTWCSNNQPREVKHCPSETCSLHPYRLGTMPGIEHPSCLKAIRGRCLDCTGGSPKDVATCKAPCALHDYRSGHRPKPADQTVRHPIPCQKSPAHKPISASTPVA